MRATVVEGIRECVPPIRSLYEFVDADQDFAVRKICKSAIVIHMQMGEN